jgi:hypothetical protein
LAPRYVATLGYHMTKSAPSNPDVTQLARAAVACNFCFETLGLGRPRVAHAQPRWIGADYWQSRPRVAFLLINPGSGESRNDRADVRFNTLLEDFAAGTRTLEEVLAHQREDMHEWGRGRFLQFYSAHLGLRLDRIAFLNVAWCATKSNAYPDPMLKECFGRHTLPLLRILQPDLLLLSGSKTRQFATEITAAISTVRVEPMLHYAHREGTAADAAEMQRVKLILQSVSHSDSHPRPQH